MLREGNAYSAKDWKEVLEPIVERYRDHLGNLGSIRNRLPLSSELRIVQSETGSTQKKRFLSRRHKISLIPSSQPSIPGLLTDLNGIAIE
jgi:hypothetical protein